MVIDNSEELTYLKILKGKDKFPIYNTLFILQLQELNKVDLELLFPNTSIFYYAKMEPLSKKRKNTMDATKTLPLDKGKGILQDLNIPLTPLMMNNII